MAKTIKVSHYQINITDTLKGDKSLTNYLNSNSFSRIFILTDSNTHKHCLPKILYNVLPLQKAEVLEVPAGEQHKSLKMTEYLWHQLIQEQSDRRTLIVNLGGGMVGDLGGFVASTYKRGIKFIQVPTTLLAMVDASVGGKLAVNLSGVKNAVGVFNNPEKVFIYTEFLETLPERIHRSGLAEVIKHSIISDNKQWRTLAEKKDLAEMDYKSLILDTIKVKKKIVERDFREGSYRKVLNFGHTLSHALESISLEQDDPLYHGEAVAIGMIMESYLSLFQVGLPEKEFQLIEEVILHYFPKFDLSKYSFDRILELMQQDKKNEKGKINFTLLKRIGKPLYNQQVSEAEIEAAFNYYTDLKYAPAEG